MGRSELPDAADSGNKPKKRSKRKIVLLMIIFVSIAVVTAEVLTIRNMTSVDRRFTRSVERGVIEGWETGSSDLQLKKQGSITDTGFINLELEAVKEYRGKSYKDKNLGKLSRRYIDDLKKCSAAAEAHSPSEDTEGFWAEFAEPYTDRLMVLRELYTGDYRLGSGWDDHPGERDEVLFRGWLASAASSLSFEKEGSEKGADKYIALFKNDSGFDIDHINLDIELYDSKNKLIGVAEVYSEDIKNGSGRKIRFYHKGEKIAAYRVSGADGSAERPDEE